MSAAIATPAEERRAERRKLLRRTLGHKGLMAGLILLGLIVACALLAPLIAPHDPYAQDLTKRMIPPVWHARGGWLHPLGTDNLGRDYLSRMLYGARISLLIGLSVMVVSGLIGTIMGVTAGYFGGRIDMAIMFIVTARLALPVVLVALAVVATIGGSLIVVVMVLGLLKWDRFAVVMRAATQQVRALEFVDAAKSLGSTTPRILIKDVMPNVMPQLIVVATVEAASAILLEPLSPSSGSGCSRRCRRGADDLGGEELHVLLLLAHRHSGRGSRHARPLHQPDRRRPARCLRARLGQPVTAS